jgi:hypothetical protein
MREGAMNEAKLEQAGTLQQPDNLINNGKRKKK